MKMSGFKGSFMGNAINKSDPDRMTLKKGKKIRVILEESRFNKSDMLDLFGIWKDKSDEEIKIFKDILEEREHFGRG